MTTAQEYAQLAQIAADETASDVAATESAKNQVITTKNLIDTKITTALQLSTEADSLLDQFSQWASSVNVLNNGEYSAKHYAELANQYKIDTETASSSIAGTVSTAFTQLNDSLTVLDDKLTQIDGAQEFILSDVTAINDDITAIRDEAQEFITNSLYAADQINLFKEVDYIRDYTSSMSAQEQDDYAEQLLSKIMADEALASRLRKSGYFVDVTTGDVGIQKVVENLNSMLGGVRRELISVTNEINDVIVAQITAVETQLSSVTETIQTELTPLSDEITAIKNTYGVRLNADGNVSGFGLVQDLIDGTATSDFAIAADTFTLAPPVYVGPTAPTDPYVGQVWRNTTNDTVYYYTTDTNSWITTPVVDPLFYVRTTPEVVEVKPATINPDGSTSPAEYITYPPGVYMNKVYIDSSSISDLQINMSQVLGHLSVDQMQSIEIKADQITAGEMSANRIYGGTMTAVTIHAGTIIAGYLMAAVLDEGSIQIDTNSAGYKYYVTGVNNSDQDSGTGAAQAALNIRSHDNTTVYDPTTGFVPGGPAWRYKDAVARPIGEASFYLSAVGRTCESDGYIARTAATVTFQVYHGTTQVSSASVAVVMASNGTDSAQTKSYSVTSGDFTYTFSHSYTTEYNSDPYWEQNCVAAGAQTCTGSITCDSDGHNYSNSSQIGISFRVSVASGVASSGTVTVSIEDTAANE